MKVFLKINLYLTAILSIATGVFKIMQQEADITLFEKIGFSATATTLLGVVQLIGGLLLLLPKTRLAGAIIMIITFTLASIAVFANGMPVFGVVSLLFIAMACWVVVYVKKYNSNT